MRTAPFDEMKNVRPSWPSCLTGVCIGGAVACEAARQLTAKGHTIGALILLDSQRPTRLKYFAYRLHTLHESIRPRLLRRWKANSKPIAQKTINQKGHLYRVEKE